MSHLPEGRLQPDPGDPPPPRDPASPHPWLEARIRAVLAVVLATWVLIAVWKVIRQLTK